MNGRANWHGIKGSGRIWTPTCDVELWPQPWLSVCLSVCLSISPERFPGIFLKTHGRNGLKLGMLMYSEHLHNWFDFDHGLLNFPHFGITLTWWNWSNLRFLGIFLTIHGQNALKFGMQMYPDQLQNWLEFGHGLLIFLYLALFLFVGGKGGIFLMLVSAWLILKFKF